MHDEIFESAFVFAGIVAEHLGCQLQAYLAYCCLLLIGKDHNVQILPLTIFIAETWTRPEYMLCYWCTVPACSFCSILQSFESSN
jgi:hypothetical protein